jgi:hypothetical protein
MGHESFDRPEPLQQSSNRTFGFVFAAAFFVIGILPWVLRGAPRLWSLALSAAFLAIAWLFPAVLAPLNRAWARFGLLLHRLVSPIVLGVMFFLVITPMGLIMRALGKNPLRLRFDPAARSYWLPRQPPGPAPDTLNNQF